jgi:hypothetical protein
MSSNRFKEHAFFETDRGKTSPLLWQKAFPLEGNVVVGADRMRCLCSFRRDATSSASLRSSPSPRGEGTFKFQKSVTHTQHGFWNFFRAAKGQRSENYAFAVCKRA